MQQIISVPNIPTIKSSSVIPKNHNLAYNWAYLISNPEDAKALSETASDQTQFIVELQESQKELQTGKGKFLKSLKDLRK